MKKPKIETVYGGDDSPSLFLVNGLHLDVDEIKENYEGMIDALIAIKSVLNKDSVFVGFEMGAGKDDYHFAMDKIEQALKKAGCE